MSVWCAHQGTGRINRDTRQFLCEAGDGLARSIVLDALNIEGLNAGQWTYCRFLLSNPADHVFAQVAAQVPQCPRILCGNDDANRDGRCIGVRDLDCPRAPVPQVRCQEKFCTWFRIRVMGAAQSSLSSTEPSCLAARRVQFSKVFEVK